MLDGCEALVELGGREQCVPNELRPPDGLVHERAHDRRGIVVGEQLESPGVRAAWGSGVEHPAAADRGRVAQDDAVASRRDDRLGEAELREAISDPNEPGRDLGRAVMDVEPDVVADRLQLLELNVDAVTDGIRARLDERVPAPERLPLDARQASATRWPASARSTGSSCTWTLRTRTSAPVGSARSSSPSPTDPDQSVPVTTVPMPRSVNARST